MLSLDIFELTSLRAAAKLNLRGRRTGNNSNDHARVFVVICLLTSFASIARAEEGLRVILVLDASGSMRMKIDGKSKMDIAKQVVGTIIKTWKAGHEIGFIAYGHREKGNCKDIEVLREPAPLNAKDYMKAVNGLSPKGQTPITAAVQMAAEALQYTEKNPHSYSFLTALKTVTLIHVTLLKT